LSSRELLKKGTIADVPNKFCHVSDYIGKDNSVEQTKDGIKSIFISRM